MTKTQQYRDDVLSSTQLVCQHKGTYSHLKPLASQPGIQYIEQLVWRTHGSTKKSVRTPAAPIPTNAIGSRYRRAFEPRYITSCCSTCWQIRMYAADFDNTPHAIHYSATVMNIQNAQCKPLLRCNNRQCHALTIRVVPSKGHKVRLQYPEEQAQQMRMEHATHERETFLSFRNCRDATALRCLARKKRVDRGYQRELMGEAIE